MKKIIATLMTFAMLVAALPMASVSAAPAADENIALGKPTFANYIREGYNTATVTDGDINNEWAGPAGTDNVYVAVDLEQPYIITSVILHNRKSEPTEHFRRNVSIEFSNTPDFAVVESVVAMGVTESPLGVPVEVKPLTKTPYRYVRALKTRNSTHIVNEIEVYGYIEDPNAIKIGADVVGTKYEGPVTLLRSLGLINLKNDADELFDTESIITRGDAASMIVNAFGSQTGTGAAIPFADVKEGNKHYAAICDAYSLGYIQGDGASLFRPNDYATKTELTYMLLRAMGYGDVMSAALKNDISKVLSLANRLNLFDNLGDYDVSQPVTRGEVAIIFYNALLSSQLKATSIENDYVLYEEGDVLLTSKLGITLTKGVVEETTITTLSGDPKANKNAVTIGGKKFVDSNKKLDDLLGHTIVVATHKDNPEEILFAWKDDKDEVVYLAASVLASELSDIKSNTVYAYDADGNREPYDLEDRYKVIKNGIAYPYYAAKDLLVKNGGLRLLDNDGDGMYEVVFIEEYTLHYIKNASSNETSFTFIDSKGVKKSLDKDTLLLAFGDGSAAGVNKVAQDTVIKLFGTPDGKYSSIQIYKPLVTGAIQEITDDSMSVLGSKYKLSKAYKDIKDETYIVPGDMVSLFVDEYGEVLWAERDLESVNDSWVIAFSQKVATGQGLDGNLAFRLYTINGAWVEASVAENVMVDGSKVTKAAFRDLIKAAPQGRYTEELVRYKLDSTGKISQFDTTYESPYEKQRKDSFTAGAAITSGIYTGNSHAFWDGQKMIAQAKEDTPVFRLPLIDGTTHPKDSAYDNYYRVTKIANEVTSHSAFSGNLASYMLDEDGYPACFALKVTASGVKAGSGTLTRVSSADSPYLLVKDIVSTVDANGEQAYKLSGYQISQGTVGNAAEIFVNAELNIIETGLLYQEESGCLNAQALPVESSVSNLPNKERYIKNISAVGVGDILHYSTDGIQISAVERVFDYEPNAIPVLGAEPLAAAWYTCGENHTFYTGRYRFQVCDLVKLSNDVITVKTLSGNMETYPRGEFSKVYVCEKSGRNIKVSEAKLENYVGTNAKFTLYSYWGSPKAIFIHTYNE